MDSTALSHNGLRGGEGGGEHLKNQNKFACEESKVSCMSSVTGTHRTKEIWKDRMGQVGSDHIGSNGPTFLLKQSHPRVHGTGLHQTVLEKLH